jgi:hypothetical protein
MAGGHLCRIGERKLLELMELEEEWGGGIEVKVEEWDECTWGGVEVAPANNRGDSTPRLLPVGEPMT